MTGRCYLVLVVFSEEFACTGEVMTPKRIIGSGQLWQDICGAKQKTNKLLQMLLVGHQALFRLRHDRDASDGDAEEEVRRRSQNAFGIQVGASDQSWYLLETFADVFMKFLLS